ncbi:MAG TPA: OB-fold domain-containing protein [Thermoleophilia bacterium]|nr:OB-fold domain-containing protein [Thermoleophilia bacterium]
MAEEARRVLMGEGLFTPELGDGNLIATHCTSCGDYFFPRTFTCHNPQCEGRQVEDVTLSRTGKVSTYSAMRYPPPPPYVAPAEYEPIPVVAVEMPEGIEIIGMMEDCAPEEVSVGMEVKTVIRVLYTNDKGEELVGWKFRQVRAP